MNALNNYSLSTNNSSSSFILNDSFSLELSLREKNIQNIKNIKNIKNIQKIQKIQKDDKNKKYETSLLISKNEQNKNKFQECCLIM